MDPTGYPTADELATIEGWDAHDVVGWLYWIRDHAWWTADDLVSDVHDMAEGGCVECAGRMALVGSLDELPLVRAMSTGGWSGNEEVIGAMRAAQNGLLWMLCFVELRVGGHYKFKLEAE